MQGLLQGLRSGAWLTAERLRVIPLIMLAVMVLSCVYLVATSKDYVDFMGRPLGTDFSNIYIAGLFVLEGEPEAPFDVEKHYARQQAMFGEDVLFFGWHYPPFLLGVSALLALLPYGAALAVWQLGTLALYLWAIWRITGQVRMPDWKRYTVLLALAYPAVFVNITHGHNGFLSCALLAGGLYLLDRRPFVAGILFGLLAYKPQFGVMIPLVLAVTGRWHSFASAALTVVAMVLLSTAAFGVEIWDAFRSASEFTRDVVLEQGGTGWHKIQSLFSWVRMLGGPVWLAYAVQGAGMVAVGGCLVWLWRSGAAFALKAAGLCTGVMLATPYSLDYDLVVLAGAIAFFVVDGLEKGFRPWEKTLVALLWLSPFVTRIVAMHIHVPLSVVLMLAFFGCILARARSQCLPRGESQPLA